VAAVILAGIMAVIAVIEHRERLRSKIAIERARTAYRDARLAREQAEVEVTEYAEGTFRQELASVEAQIRQAADELNRIVNATSSDVDWAERIRSKGYLLLIRGVPSKELAVKKAALAVEQVKSEKLVLEQFTKVKKLKELTSRVARASTDEVAKKASYHRMRAMPVGFFERIIGRK